MSKRSRRRTRGTQTTAPQQPITTSPTITKARPARQTPSGYCSTAGELDPHLTAIADAIHARLELLETINSAKALAMLNVGDRVRFNHTLARNACAASKAS